MEKTTIGETELINEVQKLSLTCLIKKLQALLVSEDEEITREEVRLIQTGLSTYKMLQEVDPDYECDDSPGKAIDQTKQFLGLNQEE